MRRPSKAPMALPIRKPITIRSMLVIASLGSVPSDTSSQKVRAVARGDGKSCGTPKASLQSSQRRMKVPIGKP